MKLSEYRRVDDNELAVQSGQANNCESHQEKILIIHPSVSGTFEPGNREVTEKESTRFCVKIM